MLRKFVPGLMICCIIVSVLFAACAPSTATQPTDPAAYQLNDIDDARHELPVGGEDYEWWYMDASFDNGYSFVTSWQIIHAKVNDKLSDIRVIQFAIYDPQGNKTTRLPFFNEDNSSSSKTSCDVVMGSNHIKGTYPKYEVEFLEKDAGCKLTFENLTQGFRNVPDGVTYFSREPERYMGWAIAQPKAKVTGVLILDGKEIPVSGTGYHDHNWGNTMLNDIYNFWHWGRIMTGDYTIVYSVGESSEMTGSKPVSVLVTFKGHDLIDLTDKLYGDYSDLTMDEVTAINYPKTLKLRVEGPNITGTITNNVKELVENDPLPGMDASSGNGYLRFLSDCDIKLDVKGEKLEAQSKLIHEFIHF
ncbi:MAG: hypothetical protein JXA01_08095 [Dehalococcoidia bacterium]|nr:hypothetical protein [Dehalococcoidia bacterium]